MRVLVTLGGMRRQRASTLWTGVPVQQVSLTRKRVGMGLLAPPCCGGPYRAKGVVCNDTL